MDTTKLHEYSDRIVECSDDLSMLSDFASLLHDASEHLGEDSLRVVTTLVADRIETLRGKSASIWLNGRKIRETLLAMEAETAADKEVVEDD